MIYINSVVAFQKHNSKDQEGVSFERILWIAPDRSYVVLVNIDNKRKLQLPYFRDYEELQDLLELEDASISAYEPDLLMLNPSNDYLNKYGVNRDKKFALIESLVGREPEIYRSESRGELIRDKAEQSGKPQKTIYYLLKRYWFYGKSINGLLHDYHDVGVTGDRREIGRKTGPKTDEANNFIVTVKDKEIFKSAIKKYHTDLKMNLTATHKHMCENHYNEGYYRKHNVMVPIVIMANCPSLRQFRYWYAKEYNKKGRLAAKIGDLKAEMNNRAILGSPMEKIYNPGELYETDSTPADVLLLSSDYGTVIGRPHVYFVKDVMSRFIVGMHISKTNSWSEAMVALENASTDKVEFCAKYGVVINEEDWPSKYLPQKIVGDRGEMKSKNSNNLVSLNVRLANPPSYRADLKPYIEQQFRSFCGRVKELIPGAVHKEHRERGELDPSKKSVYTFEVFTKIVILFVLEYNRKALSDDFLVTSEMARDNVNLTPISMWNWGAKRSLLHEEPRELIRYVLLPKEEGVVTRRGINVNQLNYACELGVKEGWFEDELIEGEHRIEVSYDPRNCSSIFVRLKNGSIVQCSLTAKFKEYEGLHIDDVKSILSFKNKKLKSARNERYQIESELDAVAKYATELERNTMKERQKGLPKSNKLKNKRSMRKLESRMNGSSDSWTARRQKEELTVKHTETHLVLPDPPSTPTSTVPVNKMQLFLLSKSRERRTTNEQ
ncbi:Mu transposase C-terminal domain-containing protein [Paenibacillus xylanilyticus]|uniref:Transposase n=1 Tax=Paenibacillus xylanilyticus TaxID=248903 RepID=A0A7Y6BSQ2_9BACL|nr:Mu transposase C-terminal domain-containing protein [Paenibacillus xylanilyticus]NUU74307.1 transposase [Paenibacillus xylanilyticus]